MTKVRKIKVSTGIYWIEVPDAGLYLLGGCPADSVKHLMKKGLIKSEERSGVTFETGPNAILLSDILVQNGHFSNLSEFPVLQMLYRQGLIIPNHPNNNGQKPILVGSRDQVTAQMRYNYRGNYGLISHEEILHTGTPADVANEMMKVKTKFAFGQIKPSDAFLDSRIVENEPVEIINGVQIERVDLNVFKITYNKEVVEVDLNIQTNQSYEVPYPLDFHRIKRYYFSIIHSGEGDGWDINHPCMASILMFQGKIYLIDAGPNILGTLIAMGINISEVEGIFHTHSHDDHFAGLPSLIRSGHRLKYYSTPLVRYSVIKKLAALLSISEHELEAYFEFHDLQFDVWNEIEGLEVKPLYSPHPVENSIFLFRTIWENGYKSYGHFADIVAMDVFEKMAGNGKNDVSANFVEKVKSDYFQKCDIKKLDVGGGMIHGKAIDFKEDSSEKIILSHSSLPFEITDKEIGSEATFGAVDILIPAEQKFAWRYAYQFLHSYFPDTPKSQLRILLNNPVQMLNPGTILLKEGQEIDDIFLLLTGNVEVIQSAHNINHLVSSGELIGQMPALNGEVANATFRAVSFVQVLKLPKFIYTAFVEKNELREKIQELQVIRRFLRKTSLFGESISYNTQNLIAEAATLVSYAKGSELSSEDNNSISIIVEGEVKAYVGEQVFEILKSRDFFGQEGIVFGIPGLFNLKANTDVELYQIPGEVLSKIPIVRWKLYEAHEKTIQKLNASLHVCSLFQWQKEYSVQVKKMDNQHQRLFNIADKVCQAVQSGYRPQLVAKVLLFLINYTKTHFDEEEALLKLYGYPSFDEHKAQHQQLINQIDEIQRQLSEGRLGEDFSLSEFFKSWIVNHIFNEDKKYGKFLNEKGVY